jgi:DNA modification methylase
MNRLPLGNHVDLSAVKESAESVEHVAGTTHAFYRYPARFSPKFARSAIENLTEHGDTVLDPFMGGGTSAVEALASGRRFVGCDINPLSLFITRVKTTSLSEPELRQVAEWTRLLLSERDLRSRIEPDSDWEGYQFNLPWWIRNAMEVALNGLSTIDSKNAKAFARCVLLKAGQWALDCRRHVPTARQFMDRVTEDFSVMALGMREYRARVSEHGVRPSKISKNRRLMLGDSAESLKDFTVPDSWSPPKLILTSPPYIGVHILYHRWQVRGRRESPAPFWIAGSLDGFGASYYTFGDRQRKDSGGYFERLKACFESFVPLMGPNSLLVQLVAFGKLECQLDLYLEAMNASGLAECDLSGSSRTWRSVPNRKWYAQQRGGTRSSREVLLVHKKGSLFNRKD